MKVLSFRGAKVSRSYPNMRNRVGTPGNLLCHYTIDGPFPDLGMAHEKSTTRARRHGRDDDFKTPDAFLRGALDEGVAEYFYKKSPRPVRGPESPTDSSPYGCDMASRSGFRKHSIGVRPLLHKRATTTSYAGRGRYL
jgi:hypothetical protein